MYIKKSQEIGIIMDFIRHLPAVILSQILTYTYQPQSKKLLNDIENYKETREWLSKLYHTCGKNLAMDSQECNDWLFNDMIAYMNNYKATRHGYGYKFYTIVRRIRPLETLESAQIYLHQLFKKGVTSQINLLLGMFNLYERNDLVLESERRLSRIA
jgi:hypothetical protein